MICSTSSLNKLLTGWRCLISGVLLVWLLTGCAIEQHLVSTALEEVTLPVISVRADKDSPQLLDIGEVRWTAVWPEGEAERPLRFELKDDSGAMTQGRVGNTVSWDWRPEKPGRYQVRVVVFSPGGDVQTGPWSESFDIAPPLETRRLESDWAQPQMAVGEAMDWSFEASGGVGELDFAFELERNGDIEGVFQQGALNRWSWQPDKEGRYRVRGIVTDEQGNRFETPWSARYEVLPPLEIKQLTVDKNSPQLAFSGSLIWEVEAQGGVGELNYRFELEKDGGLLLTSPVQNKRSWQWDPDAAGDYRVRVLVSDEQGNRRYSNWSDNFQIAEAISIEPLTVNIPSPQMVGTASVLWQTMATGGIGNLQLTFELERNKQNIEQVSSGDQTSWLWKPHQVGNYRVRVIAEDEADNSLTSSWYGPFLIVPELAFVSLTADKPAPQTAQTRPISWQAEVAGGVEPLSYSFELEKDGQPALIPPTESQASWEWLPEQGGRYRLRVKVSDARGNALVSSWTEPYVIAAPLRVAPPRTASKSPQVVATEIRWGTAASGGVGEKTIAFELRRENEEKVTALCRGEASECVWTPRKAGRYQVRTQLQDALQNRIVSDWSEPFEVAAPLQIQAFEPDRPAPQAAQSVPVNWQTRIGGGIPPYSYQFEMQTGQTQRFVQQGTSPDWLWQPDEAGSYKVRVTVIDSRGNREQSDWSKRYRVLEPLRVTTPQAKNAAEQYPLGDRILWQSSATGGVGKKTFQFDVEKRGAEITTVKSSRSNAWRWQPSEPGFYRVRARAIDKRGNQRLSDWSSWKEVRAPLAIESFQPDLASPQQALAKPIRWWVKTSGGIGQLNYAFYLQQDGREILVQRDASASWRWLPRVAGNYRLKARVSDQLGAAVESDWSAPYRVGMPISEESLVALLPVDNLSGKKIPAGEIAEKYRQRLEQQGLRFLSRERLEAFMYRHRMRYTGGLSASLAQALREEEQVDAVIVTSVASYADNGVPQLALSSRLVLCQELPRIAWIDALGVTGDDAPGLLALGRVSEVDVLLDRTLDRLVVSLSSYLQNGQLQAGQDIDNLPPQDYYRSNDTLTTKPYKIAIVPFLNRYARRNAGFIVPLQLACALHRQDNLEVFEPGLIREQLLNYRLIMRAGPSLAISDVLSSATTLDADLVLSGYIFDYQDAVGSPKIDFSTRLFAGKQRQITWWSRSYGTGIDGVFFYDFGRIRSAQVMLARMTAAISDLLFETKTELPATWNGTQQTLP